MASFLKGKDNPRETINSEEINTENTTDEDDNYENNDSLSKKSEVTDETGNKGALPPSASSSNFKPPLQKKRKPNEMDPLKTKIDTAFSILQTNVQKKMKTDVENKPKDVCELYGQLLVSKLQIMDEHTRDFAMNKIDNLLFELKMNSHQKMNIGFSSQQPNPIYHNRPISTYSHYRSISPSISSQSSPASPLHCKSPDIQSYLPLPHTGDIQSLDPQH